MAFCQHVDPTSAIEDILRTYPFSVGLLREIIQNADDAGASQVIFTLDRRSLGTNSLYSERLAGTQGPALLAYNNALFCEEDWMALQAIYQSSKKADTSKIGKYGIGFRACYHVTDNPQILSDTSLGIFDPLLNFSLSGGEKFDFVESSQYPDQLSGFDGFIPENAQLKPFPGTILRLPLRTTPSRLSQMTVQPDEIRQLFANFIEEEISVTLLFLSHISSIEIRETDIEGNSIVLAKASIDKCLIEETTTANGAITATQKVDVIVFIPGTEPVAKTWRILRTSFSQSEAASIISERLGFNAGGILEQNKLFPDVSIAMPLSILSMKENDGRLFTYLPLPLRTGFPGHIHSLFALTPARQNLRNSGEIGIVKGSDDITLVEWNRMLFDTFVPRAWSMLLQVLVQDDHLVNVFRGWPPAQYIVECGDSLYWQTLPSNLLRILAQGDLPLWPVVNNRDLDESLCFSGLSMVLLANCNEDDIGLQALTKAGLKIVQPPTYIMELLKEGDIPFAELNSETVYRALTTSCAMDCLEDDELRVILSYLLSSDNLANIVGLPLIPLHGGQYISLNVHNGIGEAYTMMTDGTIEVFGDFDPSAIAIERLPAPVAKLLSNSGPLVLNVQPLTCEKVFNYLTKGANNQLSFQKAGEPSDILVEWLSKFWIWLREWDHRDHLHHLFKDVGLLPTQHSLGTTTDGVFSQMGVAPIIVGTLESFGLSFLHPRFSSEAEGYLRECKMVNSIDDIHNLLECIHPVHVDKLEYNSASTLLTFLSRLLTTSHHSEPLTTHQKNKLRSLPIYPLLVPSNTTTDTGNLAQERGCIPDGANVTWVDGATLLPVVPGILYLDSLLADKLALSFLCAENLDILELALTHFLKQSKEVQIAFLKFMTTNVDDITNRHLQLLRNVPFITVGDGLSKASPCDIVDPESPLSKLFTDHHRTPCLSEESDIVIIHYLRLLGLLQDKLTRDIVQERIHFISTRGNSEYQLSIRLINYLERTLFDCTLLQLDNDAKWLPTADGLRGPRECSDPRAHRRELFDKVLLSINAETPSSLRTALGWDQPLSLLVIKEQLRRVLDTENPYKALKIIIKELGRRDLDDTDIQELRTIIFDRKWVPISSECVDTSHAVFKCPSGLPQFRQIPVGLNEGEILRRLGCTESPSADILVFELALLREQPPSLPTALQATELLKLLPYVEERRSQVFVPDVTFCLHPIDDVFYNDIGQRIGIFDVGVKHIAHDSVSQQLATKLGIVPLGLSGLQINDDEEDMVERLPKRIQDVLTQYTEKQVLNEFFANAVDAGATEFGLVIDESEQPVSKPSCLVSPNMACFQNCPALVLHNNTLFTMQDFRGIRRVGQGGKVDRNDTIGQFGLGALSAFHFTEMIMIVSGDQVLFLNPSKVHLSIGERASLLMPLSTVSRWYHDHLLPLNGLFNFKFSKDLEFYDGTLFRLALRNHSHISEHSLLHKLVGTRDLIIHLKAYLDDARQSVLFTSMRSIKTIHRLKSGRQLPYWTVTASRMNSSHEPEGNYKAEEIHVVTWQSSDTISNQEKWVAVSMERSYSELPALLHPLTHTHRLRSPVKTNLAACLDPLRVEIPHQIFSSLPLPILTCLPIHVNGTFILAQDRRHIRFDGYEPLVSEYNRWLLSEMIPLLYLFLLDTLLRRTGSNANWWPILTSSTDSIARIVVDEFYGRHLKNSTRYLCASLHVPGKCLRPDEAVLLEATWNAIGKILGLLKSPRIIKLPSSVHELTAKDSIMVASPSFVREEIITAEGLFISAFRDHLISVSNLESLILFLLSGGTEMLVGLPLLPVDNGLQLEKCESLSSQSECKRIFYAWAPLHPDSQLFNPVRLIHPGFNANILLNQDLNISKLTNGAVREFILDCIPEANEMDDVSTDQETWINSFWREYEELSGYINIEAISSFSLIRTMRPSFYISLNRCKSSSTFRTSYTQPDWLCSCLDILGATIVKIDTNSTFVNSILNTQSGHPHFRFEDFLLYCTTIKDSSIVARFSKLDIETHAKFVEWIQNKLASWSRESTILSSGQTSPLVHAACSLPVWPTFQKNTTFFSSASEATMLPPNVSKEVAMRFTTAPFVEFSTTLVNLNIKPMSWTTFRDLQQLPRILSHNDELVFESLLNIFTAKHIEDSRDILVPNLNRVLVKASTLYARHRLFLAAFKNRQVFILPSLQRFEDRLRNFGLKFDQNFDTFKACAIAIHEDHDGSDVDPIRRRASVVFQYYSEDLPLQIESWETSKWLSLDRLRFIPRHDLRHRSMPDAVATTYARPFPALVAPIEILRPEFEAIAWTQRALPANTLNDRVLIANQAFGVPSANEVVEHLRVLALRVALDHPTESYVLSGVTKTYQWLNDHKDEAQNFIIQYHDEALFLNVDDPHINDWQWRCADELFFNITDSGGKFGVRAFLFPFKDLLLVSGVEIIKNPPLPEIFVSSADTRLSVSRSRHDCMRREGRLTDVVFVTGSNNEHIFPGHRSYLATTSEYFWDMFCGDIGIESGPATADAPVQIDMPDYSPVTLKGTLDYLYTGVVPTGYPLDELRHLLRLSHYWGLEELSKAAQRETIQQISLDNHKELKILAESVQATDVIEACDYFERENVEAIRKLGTNV